VDSGVEIRIPNTTYSLAGDERAILVDELDKLERATATEVAESLRRGGTFEPDPAESTELARALDHLRNLRALPRGEMHGLRDALVSMFHSHRYRLDPQTGEQPFETFAYGPIHEAGERLVDMATNREWRVIGVRPGTDPLELAVEPWQAADPRD
jgi:hypothetical protein